MSNLDNGGKVSSDEWNVAKIATALFASLTIVSVLLGYGVSIALESTLNLPHSSIFDSSFDLLDLSSVAIIQILPKMVEGLGKWSTYADIFSRAWPSLLAIFLISLPVLIIGYFVKFFYKTHKPEVESKTENERLSYLKKSIALIALIFASPLISIFSVFVVLSVMVLFSMVPMIGMYAGTAYINEVAIKPTSCAPLPSSKYLNTEETVASKAGEKQNKASVDGLAQCVRVIKDKEEIASGRLVFSTSKSLIIYHPGGIAQRVPLGDAIIQTIDKLPTD